MGNEKERRSFDKEFKEEVVRLVESRSPRPVDVVMWDELCQFWMGLARFPLTATFTIELLPQHRKTGNKNSE